MSASIRIGNKWKPLLELSSKRCAFAMVAIGNDRIAIIGGWSNGDALDSVDIYNLKTKECSTFKMKDKCTLCAAVAISEKIFIFGGRSSSCAEMLDLNDESLESESLPAMSAEKYSCSAVVYNKTNIVVLGGFNHDNDRTQRFLSKVEMFDTIKYEWTMLPSMPTARMGPATGAVGSHIIVAGGRGMFGSLNIVELLDMQTQLWKQAASMNQARLCAGGAIIDHSMIVVGDHGVYANVNDFEFCEMYNFNSDEWSTIPDLKYPIGNTQLVFIEGMLIAGGEKSLEYLTLSTPGLIYKLVHLAVEFDRLKKTTVAGENYWLDKTNGRY